MKHIHILLLIIFLHKASSVTVWDENEEDLKLNGTPELEPNFNVVKLRETEGSEQLPPCNEDQLMMYLAEIQAINPEDIINLSTCGDITKLCKKVNGSIAKMDNFMKTCQPPQQKDLYMQLIKGVKSLYCKLCKDCQFRRAFEHHLKCYHELHTDLQDCNGPADWAEDEDHKKVCKAYHDIADCYYIKTAKLCGTKAAKLMKELILAVINSVLIVQCPEVKKTPAVKEPMPEEKSDARWNNVLSSNILIQLYIIYNFYYLYFK